MRATPATSKPAPKRPHWVRGVGRRVAGALCLVAWLLGASGMLPALAAGLAEIDPQHRVFVERDEHGLRLVLNHGGAVRHHRHHLPARVLMLGAAPQSNPGADHVLSFGGSSAQEGADAALLPPLPHENAAPAPAGAVVKFLVQPAVPRLVVARPPPDSPPAPVMIARSTTRLI